MQRPATRGAPCVVEQFVQFVQFALGRAPSSAESAGLLQQFRADDHSFAGMVESFVMSDAFAQHTEEP